MIKLNGKKIELESTITVYELLINNNFDADRVAVIINEDIVSKDKYKEVLIKQNDNIEVVSFVGGG